MFGSLLIRNIVEYSTFSIAHQVFDNMLMLISAQYKATKILLNTVECCTFSIAHHVFDDMLMLISTRYKAIDKYNTTREGLNWGVLFGFGPGVTVDTFVLHNIYLTLNLKITIKLMNSSRDKWVLLNNFYFFVKWLKHRQ